MVTLVAQVSPERSTQYSDLAAALAPHELRLSPLGARVSDPRLVRLGRQDFLQFELSTAPDDDDRRELGLMAMTNAYFEWHNRLGGADGPFLRPIATPFEPAFPLDLLTARRYKGKTNELLTLFLCNVARFSSAFAREPWGTLKVFDPLAGGGTTLLAALVRGADAAGVERDPADVESTVVFLKQYLQEQGIRHSIREERLRKLGHRWSFAIGKEGRTQCILARGETTQARELLGGFRPHLIVTDLPYGIQHHGDLEALLKEALPAWATLLRPGGVMALAWDATRFSRPEMIGLAEACGPLTVLDEPPYDALAHRVDRVIKHRDVLVARFAG